MNRKEALKNENIWNISLPELKEHLNKLCDAHEKELQEANNKAQEIICKKDKELKRLRKRLGIQK